MHVMICLASAMPGTDVSMEASGLALLKYRMKLANLITTLQSCAEFHGVAHGAWLCQDDTGQCALHTSLMQAHPS